MKPRADDLTLAEAHEQPPSSTPVKLASLFASRPPKSAPSADWARFIETCRTDRDALLAQADRAELMRLSIDDISGFSAAGHHIEDLRREARYIAVLIAPAERALAEAIARGAEEIERERAAKEAAARERHAKKVRAFQTTYFDAAVPALAEIVKASEELLATCKPADRDKVKRWLEAGCFEFAVAIYESWQSFPGIGQVEALDVLRRPWDDKRITWPQRFGIDPTDDQPKRDA